jgi:hypothetical protein
MVFCAASATAFAASGTLEMSATSYGAAQNLGVKITTVNRVGGSSGTASVTCKTVGSTALAGRDFTAVTRTLTWANGDAAPKNCDVPISNQTPFNGQRSFSVQIAGASGAAVGSPAQSTVIIYGTEANTRVSLSSASYSIKQNAGSVTVSVARTGVADAAKVAYATANSTAIAGTDYSAEHGELTWSSGDMSPKTIVIPVSNAKPFSGTKAFALAIASPVGASMVTHSAIVTISGDAAASTAPTTGEATLSWVKPTTDADGSVLTNLAGYKIFYGNSTETMNSVVQISNPATLSYEIAGLSKGTWYFTVVAYNSLNIDSTPSATASKAI